MALPVLPPGATLRGVRLASDRVRAVLGVPASELTDRVAPLADLAPGRLVRAVEDAVGVDDARAQAVVNTWFAAVEPDPRAAAASRVLWHYPQLEVSQVAARVGLSSRQLRRALLAEVGLGPKTLQRIGRLQRFLALARSDPGRGLAELAADAGFADQPHLSREVRALAGLTPVALLTEQRTGLPTPAPIISHADELAGRPRRRLLVGDTSGVAEESPDSAGQGGC